MTLKTQSADNSVIQRGAHMGRGSNPSKTRIKPGGDKSTLL